MLGRIACLSLWSCSWAVAAAIARAQDDEPTAEQIAAIRDCAEKNQDDVTEAERLCLFNLVATPCQSTSEGQSNLGMADCFRLEGRIWDDLLNDNFKHLRASLDDQQIAKAREMQRAWIASRDTHLRLLRGQNPRLDGDPAGRGLHRPGDRAAGVAAQISRRVMRRGHWPISVIGPTRPAARCRRIATNSLNSRQISYDVHTR